MHYRTADTRGHLQTYSFQYRKRCFPAISCKGSRTEAGGKSVTLPGRMFQTDKGNHFFPHSTHLHDENLMLSHTDGLKMGLER